jgi:glycyl-tRNA synthetase beta chain
MGELLLELLSEEIPARMQADGIGWLSGFIRQRLLAAQIPAVEIKSYVTPRRMVIVAHGIPRDQPDQVEVRRGPRVGALQSAIAGFLRSAGLSSVEELKERELPSGRFYFAEIKRLGRATTEVLPQLVRDAVTGIPWPKSMRFSTARFRWVRPLTSVICLYDGEIVPLALDDVPVGRTTRGHRFLAPGEICVRSAAEYLEKLQHAFVIIDQDRRREMIRAALDRRAAEVGAGVKPDPQLLDEVTGLAEFPVVLAGAVDPDFMSLPPEVLMTAMRRHQKYFSSVNPDGSAAPHFLFVANNLAEDGGEKIIAGNERVLRARLADARFFWDQDRKVRLEDRVEALKGRVYHEKLGTMYDKVGRIEKLAGFLAGRVPGADVEASRRAARLAKADLSTGMVGEFPELQGIMGRYYAGDDEEPAIADAIASHYQPTGSHDTCPHEPLGIVVALSDRLDALVGFFSINERPTGSRDPFALRRAALGVIRLIRENLLRLPLGETIDYVSSVFSQTDCGLRDVKPDLLSFIEDRLKVYLREEGIGHDLIAAVFALEEDDLVRLLTRVSALRAFLITEDGVNLLTAYRRAANIVAIEERRDGSSYAGDVNSAMLIQDEEIALLAALTNIGDSVSELVQLEQFSDAMAELWKLRPPIDEFFEKVTVNTNESELRENRLRLLSRIRATMNRVADFSQIEG